MSKVYTINTGNKAQFLSEYALLSGSRITGSLFGTASWAQSSSVATSASFAPIGPGTTNRIALFNSTNTVSSSLIVQSGDSIGVNTSSPTNFGAGYTTLAVNNTTAGVLELMSNGVSQFRIFGNGTENRLHGVTSAAMTFYTNNSERVRIDTSGNVGIGTTSPTAKLQISGASDSYLIDAHSGAFGGRAVLMPGRFFIGTLSSGYPEIGYNFNAFNSVYTKLADDTAWKITFGGSNRMDFANVGTGTGTFSWTTRMSILSASGNVGIGTTNPADLLHVYKTTNDAQVRAETAGAGAYFYAKSATDGYAGLVMVGAGSEKFFIGSYGNDAIQFMRGRSGNEFMRITSAGDVGIGTTSNFDGSKLDVRSGKIVAGTDSSTAGSVTIQNYYTGGALSLWGSMYSSGGPLMGYGVKSSTGSANSFLSATGISISRGAYIIEGNIHRWYNGANQSVAIDSPVTMTERMIMDANGNVGIGTTNPTGKLHVQGASLYLSTTDDWAASTGSGLVIARGAATGNTYSSIYGVQSGGGSYANLVVPGGNVGIGTTDPGTKLDVIGTSRARTLYAQGVSGDSGNIIIQSGSSNAFWISGKANAGGAGTLHIGANGPTEPTAGVIVINTSNNVGIGTTNFSAKLQVSGSVVATAYNEPTTLGAVLAADGTNALLYARNGSTSWAPMFIDATTLYLNAQSSGNVGIGTTSPSNRLQIQGNVSASSYTSSINNAVGFLGTASRAVSASRADSAALVDVLSGGSTTGLGIYSGSFFGTSSWATTASFALNAGGATAGFPFSGNAVITGSLLVSSSGIILSGSGLTGSVFGTSSFAISSSFVLPSGLPSGTISSSGQVNHNTTTNYVANQHIDHTSVSINAGNGLTGGGTIAASRTLTVRYVPSTDDRATNSPPASSSAGLYADFKENTTDGLSDGGTYHGVLTFRPYGTTSDFSGGPAHQLGFTERGGLYLRTGSSNSWGPWGRLAYQTGSILGTASFATTASFAQTGGAVANALTFSNTGNGATTGTTYNGSVARTISYNSVGAIQGTQTAYSAITSGSSGDWFPLFTMAEATNGPVYCSISTYAHSSVSFVAVDGYGPSNFNHIVILGNVWNANSGFANISGVRITDAGVVQIRLTWTTGPTVDIDVALTCAGTPPALSANLSVDNSGTINDSVDLTTLNGYIRTENGYYGGTNLVLNANGVSYLNGGNVGIGTTSPTAKLHVTGSTGGVFEVDTANAATTLYVSASGNVGIGTSSPAQRLDVSGSIAIAGTAIVNTSRNLINLGSLSNDANTGFFNIIDSGKQIQLTDGTRDLRINSTFGGSNAAMGTVGSHDLNLFTANSFRVTIKSDGNVGIGTTNPGYKLDVYNPGNLAQFLSNDGTFNPRLQISGSSEGIHIYQTYSTAADSLVLGTGGAERMRIKGSNVGIGTATPAYPLQVRRAGGAGSLGISIDNVGSTDRTVQYFAVQDSAAGLGAGHAWYYRPPSSTTDTFGMILDENGNVGIGLTTPGQALSVSGSRIAVDGETLLIGRVFTDNNYIGLKTSYQTSGDFMILSGKIDGNTYLSARSGGNVVVRGGGNSSTAELNITPSVAYFNGNLGVGTAAPGSNRLQVQGNVSASSYTSSINNAVGFLGTSSWAVSASRADSSALIDVLSGGSTTGLGIYSGSFSGSFFGSLSGGGSGAGFPYSGSAVITGSLLISGSGLQVTGSTTTSGSILPAGDNMFDLGSSARRWANLYTGDLVLSNEGSSGNNVDGTTGNWTVQEGDAHLYIINNKSGKKYKFVLEEIE